MKIQAQEYQERIQRCQERVKEAGYETGEEMNIFFIYVDEITETIVKQVNQVMKGYPKSYGIKPKAHKTQPH